MTPGQQRRKDQQDEARRLQQADEKVHELEEEIKRLQEEKDRLKEVRAVQSRLLHWFECRCIDDQKEVERLREALSVACELTWPFDEEALLEAAAEGDWETVEKIISEWRAYSGAFDGGGESS